MFSRVFRKMQEMPPRFFLIAGITLVVIISTISILIPPANNRVDTHTNQDYKVILNQYSTCSACVEYTGENPTFNRISYPSSGDYSSIDSFAIDVFGNDNTATIDAALTKGINRIEIIEWKYTNQDTCITLE